MRRKISVILIIVILSNYINISASTTQIILKTNSYNKNIATSSEVANSAEYKKKTATKSISKKKATSATASNIFRVKPKKDKIYNVVFPAVNHVYLDPRNISKKGQIFSKKYEIENYGNTDVIIKIKNINIKYRLEDNIYEFSETEITDKYSQIKKLNIYMIWKNESEQIEKTLNITEGVSDEYVLYLKASEYSEDNQHVKLANGSTGFFYFTGTLNTNPNIEWESGELVIDFNYEIIDTEDEEYLFPFIENMM